MLPSHDRFPYSPITARPDFTWPEGKRLALYVAVCIEHFSYNAGGLGLSYSPGLPHPNTYNWAWREYGNRVGGFRLLDDLVEHGIRPTALVNSECYDHCPDLLAAYREAGTEFVGHGRTNSQHPNGLPEEEERQVVREVYETIARGEGTPPRGWMSPGANPSERTEDLIAEQGFTYTLDWPMDDQPTWMTTSGAPILSVPYPHEVNDVPAITMHDVEADGFARMTIDTVDEMLEQSAGQPLVCGITIHTFIVGQPFRLRRFRDALDHIAGLSDELWLTTSGDIARYYADEVEPAPVAEGSAS
jgi:allantoinase